jgi:hypothetical protein
MIIKEYNIFFKNKIDKEYHWETIDYADYIRNFLRNYQYGPSELDEYIIRGSVDYINNKLVGKTIKLKKSIKILEDYVFISSVDGIHGGKYKIGTYEIIVRNSELLPIRPIEKKRFLISIYDENNIEYISNGNNFLSETTVKKKMTYGIKTEEDPYGEENWEE